MTIINSGHIIHQLDSYGIRVYNGLISESTDIYFSIDNGIDKFISFAVDLEIRHMFIKVDILTEEDIEFITEEMISDKGVPSDYSPVIKKEADEFNKELKKLSTRIGEEQSIHLFFSHHGTIYSFIVINDELYPDDPEEFIDNIMEENKDKIDELRNQERQEKRLVKQKIMSKLETEIVAYEQFKTCTNDSNRRAFSTAYYCDKEDFFTNNDISEYEVYQFIVLLWSKHKDSFKKK